MNFGTELFLFIVRDEIFINRLVTFRLAQLYCVNLISFRDFYAGQANTRGRIVQQTKRPLGSTVLLNVQSPVSVFVDTNTRGVTSVASLSIDLKQMESNSRPSFYRKEFFVV